MGADVQVHRRHELVLPLNPAFEPTILVMSGDCARWTDSSSNSGCCNTLTRRARTPASQA
jgi:hypothetical protein